MTQAKAMQGLASRRVAVEVLLKVEQNEAFANNALSAAFKQHSLSERDRSFVTYIVQGTLRHQSELDDELSKLSKKAIPKLSPPLRAVLRSALFQLIHMKDMPPSAVINIAVEISRKTGHEGQAKFTNGVLRSFLRSLSPSETDPGRSAGGSPASTAATNEATNKITSLCKKYSLPEWIVERWSARFDEAECSKLFEHTQKIPLLTLRTSEESISTEGLLKIFESKGMVVEQSKLLPCCLNIIDRGPFSGPVSKLPGYDDGLFCVQDDASALVSKVVDPQPGQTIVDLCAAPGGKSVQLGEMMQNKGRVVAVDSSAKRLSLLGTERRRLGLQNIETVVMDGREFKIEPECDAVLIDAPCSGTGVLNRRSDLRQNRKEDDLAALVKIQQELLENAASLVKPGGTLVYSTCSIEPEENVENLKQFQEKHPNFKAESLERFFTKETLESWQQQAHWAETSRQLSEGYIQLLPSRHGCSGFFICRLKRES